MTVKDFLDWFEETGLDAESTGLFLDEGISGKYCIERSYVEGDKVFLKDSYEELFD